MCHAAHAVHDGDTEERCHAALRIARQGPPTSQQQRTLLQLAGGRNGAALNQQRTGYSSSEVRAAHGGNWRRRFSNCSHPITNKRLYSACIVPANPCMRLPDLPWMALSQTLTLSHVRWNSTALEKRFVAGAASVNGFLDNVSQIKPLHSRALPM